MPTRMKQLYAALQRAFARLGRGRRQGPSTGLPIADGVAPVRYEWRTPVLAGAGAVFAGALAWAVFAHPPVRIVGPGEAALRQNRFTGSAALIRDGSVLVLPGIHELRLYSLKDRTWSAAAMSRSDGPAPAQTVEGLSIGLDLSVRYAIDPARISGSTRHALPEDVAESVVAPAVQGTVYQVIARHTVREIFSTQRAEIRQAIANDLRAKLAGEGIVLRDLQIGNVDLPADYRKGLDGLLAEGLATEKMRYTLELKDKRVKETALDAEAEKVRRESNAEAAAREQIIAARAQEEAMKHVLPLKQRQVEQRQLEAEAERQARVKQAEGSAQARRIEAQGEAEARQRLADAEAYRLVQIGKANAEQMAAEGALITKHPLLIQKAMADRLSDKIQVIIAPPSEGGGFIGNALVGQVHASAGARPDAGEQTTEQ